MRKLKAEWWELWWVKPGEPPVFIRMYGVPAAPWIPDGCFPTKKLAVEMKKRRQIKYDRIIHVRRYSRQKG